MKGRRKFVKVNENYETVNDSTWEKRQGKEERGKESENIKE